MWRKQIKDNVTTVVICKGFQWHIQNVLFFVISRRFQLLLLFKMRFSKIGYSKNNSFKIKRFISTLSCDKMV